MSDKKTKIENGTQGSKKSKNRMFLEFEDGIKVVINKYQILRGNISKKAEEELEQLIDKIVVKYYE